MENEKRLIWDEDAKRHLIALAVGHHTETLHIDMILNAILHHTTAVNAVEVTDKKLLRAVKLLIKQYERSKQSDFVHNPIAHAFYHTWKQLDESRYGERRSDGENCDTK